MPSPDENLGTSCTHRQSNRAQCAETTERRTITRTRAHLRSARVVVVGPAASPAARTPIGHARPTAAGVREPLIGDERPTYASEVFGCFYVTNHKLKIWRVL